MRPGFNHEASVQFLSPAETSYLSEVLFVAATKRGCHEGLIWILNSRSGEADRAKPTLRPAAAPVATFEFF